MSCARTRIVLALATLSAGPVAVRAGEFKVGTDAGGQVTVSLPPASVRFKATGWTFQLDAQGAKIDLAGASDVHLVTHLGDQSINWTSGVKSIEFRPGSLRLTNGDGAHKDFPIGPSSVSLQPAASIFALPNVLTIKRLSESQKQVILEDLLSQVRSVSNLDRPALEITLREWAIYRATKYLNVSRYELDPEQELYLNYLVRWVLAQPRGVLRPGLMPPDFPVAGLSSVSRPTDALPGSLPHMNATTAIVTVNSAAGTEPAVATASSATSPALESTISQEMVASPAVVGEPRCECAICHALHEPGTCGPAIAPPPPLVPEAFPGLPPIGPFAPPRSVPGVRVGFGRRVR